MEDSDPYPVQINYGSGSGSRRPKNIWIWICSYLRVAPCLFYVLLGIGGQIHIIHPIGSIQSLSLSKQHLKYIFFVL
jgi:hypothetical protein